MRDHLMPDALFDAAPAADLLHSQEVWPSRVVKENDVLVGFFAAKTIRCRSAAIGLALMFSLTACKPNVVVDSVARDQMDSADARVQSVPISASNAAFVWPAIQSSLAVEMPYAAFRKILLDAGWLPLRDPACRKNLDTQSRVCFELPEVESCGVDGDCVVNFASEKDRAKLRATTGGDYRNWNREGEEPSLRIKSFSFSPVGVSVIRSTSADNIDSPVCPARDFDAFLKAFASDPAVKRRFTASMVKIAESYSDDLGDRQRMVYMLGEQYDKFNLSYSDGGFRIIDSVVEVDQKPIEIDVKKRGADSRLVRYMYGVSEGNSYLFEKRSGC